MKNELAINDFRSANHIYADEFGDLKPFKCVITYKSKIGNPTAVANVRLSIHGLEFGNINIDETEDIPQDKYHLSFTISWQKYKFNPKDNSLKISGTSDKMLGNYELSLKVVK